MRKLRMRLLTLGIAALGLGVIAPPANAAMHCTIAGQPDLSAACNKVISVLCTTKYGFCL